MKVFIHGNTIFKEEMLEGLNKRLKNQAKPQIKNPVIQEVPDDCDIKDFENGIFSQALYDARKAKVFQAYYKRKVRDLIRQKYDEDDEFAILRQRDSKPTEFVLYNTYVEDCKKQVKEMLGMEQ